jgi:hypothetical protein
MQPLRTPPAACCLCGSEWYDRQLEHPRTTRHPSSLVRQDADLSYKRSSWQLYNVPDLKSVRQPCEDHRTRARYQVLVQNLLPVEYYMLLYRRHLILNFRVETVLDALTGQLIPSQLRVRLVMTPHSPLPSWWILA